MSGLTPGARSLVRMSGLDADVDLEVYGDGYRFASLCSSYNSGTVDDFCTAPANAAGELFVEADGESTSDGGSFKLEVTAASKWAARRPGARGAPAEVNGALLLRRRVAIVVEYLGRASRRASPSRVFFPGCASPSLC